VEESEADLDRFRAWLAEIEARDYFTAPGGERAGMAASHCEQELSRTRRVRSAAWHV